MMALVTEKDIAIAICKYLDETAVDFDFVPSWTIDRNASAHDVKEYLRASATILGGRKKKWIVVNDDGDAATFTTKSRSRHKERYGGNLHEYWSVELESDKQSIFATFEYNHTTYCTVHPSGLTLSNKVGENGISY